MKSTATKRATVSNTTVMNEIEIDNILICVLIVRIKFCVLCVAVIQNLDQNETVFGFEKILFYEGNVMVFITYTWTKPLTTEKNS